MSWKGDTEMSETFEARVTKDSLVFSAAHFITFNGNICERLHGHNWRVDVRVCGVLDENSYVFDFIALRDTCQSIVQTLDHSVLLPDRHKAIHVTPMNDETEVEVRFEKRRWLFPAEDCRILPVANTTAELIARWFASELTNRLQLNERADLSELQVSIEENFGQWATFRTSLSSEKQK